MADKKKATTKQAAKEAVAPEPAVPKSLDGDLSPEQEIAELRKRIDTDLFRIWQLEHPVIEYPKMVGHRKDTGPALTFGSRAEQDAAGPDYADR